MARIYITQIHEGWLVPTICTVYGALAIFTAFMIAMNISIWREKVLRKLPATVQDHTILRGTVTALFVLVPSLLWPVILAITISTTAIIWLASEIEECRVSQLKRRQTEQRADLERAIFNSRHGEHRPNTNEQGGQAVEMSMPSPAMVHVTEPPPVYTPYAPAHTVHQGQWRRTPDWCAEQHCFLLNNARTPDELLGSSSRVNMIPSR
ncbi:hypothetical protein INS49_005831 [Diaporthe citri]|uniref:uncharacterized protein n=1 Tax=Diaporthe citri TaxID=83186 RepID=UPI001C815008|nr:uncharacterized protein INS49_005831 [Diaporthe citri]KAG6364233.1 hypothetical protein INS49_005831 [Diaporthe citri]